MECPARARARMDPSTHIISAVSKLESWFMAHFEATLMHKNYQQIALKMAKMSQIVNFPEFLAIKLERKLLQTPFWYQPKALHEHSQNKLFWQQINMHKVSTSPKNTIFGSKTAISRPLINLKITTFNIKPTPKIFFGTVHYPY